ncbi:NAD(P)H-binding protein [Elizabethkingia occulta]|uniref:NmrA family transcriptional regulator n=1 Tax=Elizabethkingia occulta TaxID=1867263 RepID=A0A1T3MTK6_9FLAO|nr:NAD(P)H-binding protein [Elizabethkingia occulta]OPB87848.1 NmrA family transcriptional regulator [Elizabethkingia occulta]OPC67610.1 NmrA family transcriptional regulator [Elizabethkingia occulta]
MKKTKPVIVVFGCTGTIGREIMQQLKNRDCMARGVLRSPERIYPVPLSSNITYVSASLNSIKQLKEVCSGADALFLLTATSPDQIEYEINIINAARQCGIKRIVKLSAPIVQPLSIVKVSQWHNTIDNYLIRNIDEFCCLRPHSFMQNWERNTFTIQHFGKIYGSLDNAKRNYIDSRDVAEVAVNYLLTSEEVKQDSVILAGPQAITNIEMAEKISLVTGRKIEYINITPDELFSQLTKKAKLPEWLASHIVELDDLAIKVPEPENDTITNLISRKPRIIDEYLQESRHLFKRKPLWKLLF